MERGISNKFINKVLYKTTDTYGGCWSSNNIPFHILVQQNYFSIVINTARQGERGQHFMALLVSPSSIRVFDSLSLFNLPEELKANLKKYFPRRRLIFTPPKAIQDISSVFCGFFVIYSVLMFEKHVKKPRSSSINFSKPYVTNLKLNDDICVREIIKLLTKT